MNNYLQYKSTNTNSEKYFEFRLENEFILQFKDHCYCKFMFDQQEKNLFPVWLQSHLISALLEPVLSRTEKASYCRQFSTSIKIKIIKSIPVLLFRSFG